MTWVRESSFIHQRDEDGILHVARTGSFALLSQANILQKLLLVGVEVHMDRIQRDDRRYQRGVAGPTADQVSFGDIAATYTARNRCPNAGVAQIELRRFNAGLSGFDGGVRRPSPAIVRFPGCLTLLEK